MLTSIMMATAPHEVAELNSISLANSRVSIPELSMSDREIEKTNTSIAILLLALRCLIGHYPHLLFLPLLI